MIDPALQQPALKAIHFMITQARFWAYCDEPHAQIAALLDDAEYLLTMLFEDEERTEEFVETLARAAKEHRCIHAHELVTKQITAIEN